ncbi:MAG: type II toxin-antitoxin system HicB family antitoxin [Planctomycetaceae bacterium]
MMNFNIELEQEDDGRWLGEVLELPGVLAYGDTRNEAIARVQALALRVIADRIEHGEAVPQMSNVSKHTGLQPEDL